ncbi:MAG: amidase domain-containing protein, partial [Oscillospiraceae bacterium]|nr:amidase domain-containing protein [Oscillospiraceae bacterium]
MRTKPALLLVALILLASCSAGGPEQVFAPAPETSLPLGDEDIPPPVLPAPSRPEQAPSELGEAPEPPQKSEEPPPTPEEIFEERLANVYWQIEGTTDPEQVITGYLALQNLSYYSLREVDLRVVLDMNEFPSYNEERWFNNLVQRRRLLAQTGYCYVNTEPLDYRLKIISEEELADERMDYWRGQTREALPGEVYIHFVVEGEPGEGYSPLLAVNAQHTVRMAPNEDGVWKINMHYFPGAARKYIFTDALGYRDDGEVLAELEAEFAFAGESNPMRIPNGAATYDPYLAADYALAFTEGRNEAFYRVDDWSGNCQNFVSQCILYGFGGGEPFDEPLTRYMDGEWFSGGGGGSFAWENVDYFWEYAVSGQYLVCGEPGGAADLRLGDIIQTRTAYTHRDDDSENYNHTLLVM